MFSEQAGDLVSNISHLADDGGGLTKAKLTWKHFKSEGYEAANECAKEVEEIATNDAFRDKYVNLANYIIEEPQICHTKDKLRKVCDLFRHM